MKYDRNLPLETRINKRRKYKRRRFFSTVLIFSLLVAAIYILYINGTFGNIRNSVFTLAENTQDSTHKQNTNESSKEATANTGKGTNPQENTTSNPGESTGGTGKNQNEGSITDVPKPRDTSVIKSELETYIKGFEGQYGIHFVSLVDGTEFGINETDEYIAASTVKVPINLLIFKKIKDGSINPESLVTYTKADYEGGTGSLQYKKVGTRYTVRQLSKLSIEQSDNVATNMLVRFLGGRKVYKEFMRQAGGIVVDDKKNISCPKDMSLYVKMVYDFYNEDSKLGEELMGYLENTIFNDRLNKLLPSDVKVAHKIGTQVRAIHDVGIVYSEKPYIISVMSKGVNESEAPDVIANISKKVYDFAAGK